MSRRFPSLAALLLLCTPAIAPAVAQQPPYMTLVGELVGAVDSPRVGMETCVTRKAGRREALDDLATLLRHLGRSVRDVLVGVRRSERLQRAERRLDVRGIAKKLRGADGA